VQIYRLIKEWTAWDIARRAAFAFFGIFSGTEENPEFIQSMACLPNDAASILLHLEFLEVTVVWHMLTGVESKLDKNAKIIVACSSGGTMKPSQNLPEGQQSRWFQSFDLYKLFPYSSPLSLHFTLLLGGVNLGLDCVEPWVLDYRSQP
jgi:hypothetical protein